MLGSRAQGSSHIGRRLVEDEDARVLQQRAGHAQQLPLAGAQVGAALHQLSVQVPLCRMRFRDIGSSRLVSRPEVAT